MKGIAHLAGVVAEWLETCDEADVMNAALPEAARARIEAQGPGTSPLAAAMAVMPSGDRQQIRGDLEDLAVQLGDQMNEMLFSAPAQPRRRCPAHAWRPRS